MMPRANRYMLPGNACHLTHRCHNGSFLFRFARDRTEYRKRLRAAAGQFKLSVLTYCITSNHVHLLLVASSVETISQFMQKLEVERSAQDRWTVRENRDAYNPFWTPEIASNAPATPQN